MTTSIEVKAHCDEGKKILVHKFNGDTLIEQFLLANGEKTHHGLYEHLSVKVVEVPDENQENKN